MSAPFLVGDVVIDRATCLPGVVHHVHPWMTTVRFPARLFTGLHADFRHALGDDAVRCECGRMFLPDATTVCAECLS